MEAGSRQTHPTLHFLLPLALCWVCRLQVFVRVSGPGNCSAVDREERRKGETSYLIDEVPSTETAGESCMRIQ